MFQNDAASTYCSISGGALLVLGATGFFFPDLWGVVEFDRAHNVFHLVAGGLAASAALNEKDWVAPLYAQGSGAVYVLLGIAGFVSPTLGGIGESIGLQFEVGENVLHLILGGWGLYAGFTQWNMARWSHA